MNWRVFFKLRSELLGFNFSIFDNVYIDLFVCLQTDNWPNSKLFESLTSMKQTEENEIINNNQETEMDKINQKYSKLKMSKDLADLEYVSSIFISYISC